MAEWLECWTTNSEALSSRPTLTASWIYSWYSRDCMWEICHNQTSCQRIFHCILKKINVVLSFALSGLCGGSASGKTTVANKIIEQLGVPWVCMLSLDSFYKVGVVVVLCLIAISPLLRLVIYGCLYRPMFSMGLTHFVLQENILFCQDNVGLIH